MSCYSIVAKIAEISNLESSGEFERLLFENISYREWPSRKGFERTESGRWMSVNWAVLGGVWSRGVDRGKPLCFLLWTERKHRGM